MIACTYGHMVAWSQPAEASCAMSPAAASPSSDVRMSTWLTSTSMRGKIFHAAKYALFSRTLVHESLPPL